MSRIFILGGIEEVIQKASTPLIETSPCFEWYGYGAKLNRRANLTSQRQYMCTIVLEPVDHGLKRCVSPYIYCLGGKSKFSLMFKTIEKYLVD